MDKIGFIYSSFSNSRTIHAIHEVMDHFRRGSDHLAHIKAFSQFKCTILRRTIFI